MVDPPSVYRIAGLVEGLMAIHQPRSVWSGSCRPTEDHCSCGEKYPCRTLCLVAETLDSDPPAAQSSGRWVDAPGFWRGGLICVAATWPEYLSEVEVEMEASWTDDQRRRYAVHLADPDAVYRSIDETGEPL